MNHPYSANAYLYANRNEYSDYQVPAIPKDNGFHSFLPSQSLDSLPQASPLPWSQKFQDSLLDDENSATLSRHPYSSITSYSDVGHSDSPYTRFTADSLPTRYADSPDAAESPRTNHDRRREPLLRPQRSLDSFTAQVLEKSLHNGGDDYLALTGGMGLVPGPPVLPRSRSHNGHAYARAYNTAPPRRWASDRARMPLESRINYPPPNTLRLTPSKKNPLLFERPREYEYLPNSHGPDVSLWDEKGGSGGWHNVHRSKNKSPWVTLRRRLRGAMKRIKRMLS